MIAGRVRRLAPVAAVFGLDVRRSASIRLTTLDGSRSRGASIFWPDCFFLSSSLETLRIGPLGVTALHDELT
jgi:hypothetical protein